MVKHGKFKRDDSMSTIIQDARTDEAPFRKPCNQSLNFAGIPNKIT